MNDLVTIGNTQFTAKTLDGKPVLTFPDIDAIHHRPEGSARKRFNDNRQRFVEGEDYFVLDQPSEIRTLGIQRPQGGTPPSVTLITESGYLMIVKSFTDDWAWEVQRRLVKTYFRAKKLSAAETKPTSPSEMFALQAQVNLDYERKLLALEERFDTADRRISAITDVFAAPPTDEEHWRDVMNRKVRQMCEEYGVNYHTTIGEMYAELERRAHVNLSVRQKNLRERMRLGGAKYAQREAVSKLVVISQDAKLRYIYEAIVREKAAQLAASRTR